MEVLGTFAFVFGMVAMAMVTSLQGEVKKLKQEVDELKQKQSS
jgi:hypothetical protein